jgi:arginase
MIFLNPQWQGAGNMRDLEKGAHTLAAFAITQSGFMDKADTITVPLSDLPLDTINEIAGYQPICEQLENFRQLVSDRKPEKMSTIGGDCGIEIVPVSYLNKQYDHELIVVWFDGHADLNSPASSPSKHFHGMPVRTLLGEGDRNILEKAFSVLTPSQFVYIGVNDMDPAEARYVSEHQIDLIPVPDHDLITKAINGKRRDHRQKKQHIYIHFDLDVLSEKEFSHTPFPNKTGFAVADAERIVRALKRDFDVVGSSVTESIADSFEKLRPVEKLLKELLAQ